MLLYAVLPFYQMETLNVLCRTDLSCVSGLGGDQFDARERSISGVIAASGIENRGSVLPVFFDVRAGP